MTDDCYLFTATDGGAVGPAFLVLHNRNESLEDARKLGERLGPEVRRIAVRSLRTQTVGAQGQTFGHFWYIGPVDAPELSTLCDGLQQLEVLLHRQCAETGGRIGLCAKGEGGVVATLLALLWPEKFTQLILIDTPLPINIDRIPIPKGPLHGLPVTLLSTDGVCDRGLTQLLTEAGAAVFHGSANGPLDDHLVRIRSH